MKWKLTLHFFVTLVISVLTIIGITVGFIYVRLYGLAKSEFIYSYSSANDFTVDFSKYIYKDGKDIEVHEEGLDYLKENDIKLQILNSNNSEIYNFNRPNDAKLSYSTKEIVDLYSRSGRETLFLNEVNIGGENYTCLLFFNPSNINRLMINYDPRKVLEAHGFFFLIFINVMIILLISLMYTVYLTKPINSIINSVISLSKGKFVKLKKRRGLYSGIAGSINELSSKMQENAIERKRLDTMREEWISNISHDIKTPLTSIRGNAEIMADKDYYIDNETRIKSSEVIINKSDYIKNLVDDLNLSTKLKGNKYVLNKEVVNIVSLLRHTIIDIVNDTKYEDRVINFRCEKEIVNVEIDKFLMERVFINLITNSLIHNNKDVVIDVYISKNTLGDIHISIIDNGVGVSEEDLKHIFERYYRGTSTTKAIEGSGLGMAIAHDIIVAHNGSIRAKSSLGAGMKIEIII
ncbi:sensor histidine kinase [Clostridium sp. LP20]|uniref:sensor histidine kinase n=1 Tax=Clostridium sp. LP20 TaxID=3418665 RepID=UPI003EE5058C